MLDILKDFIILRKPYYLSKNELDEILDFYATNNYRYFDNIGEKMKTSILLGIHQLDIQINYASNDIRCSKIIPSTSTFKIIDCSLIRDKNLFLRKIRNNSISGYSISDYIDMINEELS